MKYLFYLFIGLLFPVSVSAQGLNIVDFGAVGDGKTDNTEAVQKAIDEASRKNTTLVFPTGTFMTGMIHLKSNVTIELKSGSVWQAVPDLKLFPEIPSNADLSQSGGYTMSRRAFIFGDNLENVTLTGDGTIYPSGDQHEAFPMLEENGSKRPYGIYFRNCQNITVRDLTLTNSAFWMLRTYLCDNVRIHNIELFNHANTNNDGMDIVDCHRVHISDCTVDSADDGICLKTEAPKGTEDVVITNCIVSSTASYIKLGTGSFGTFKRITVSNCVLRPTRATKIVHGLGYRNGITGLSLMSVDGCDIENISFNNIVMDGMMTPIFIRLSDRHKVTHTEYNHHPITAGTIKNISYSNITATNIGSVPVNITGYPEHYVEGVSMHNCKFEYNTAGTVKDLTSEVPENSKNYPYPKMYGTDLPASGIYFRHVKNIIFDQVQIAPAEGDPRPAIHFDDVINYRGENVLVDYQDIKKKQFVIKNSGKLKAGI
ncbi:glycoside hydrolase family 28 protein [Persicobacter diffluens]|uniref:Exo-poly-alpha-D-galacturonosidase n=1 Tax=Persicobacter diffluens TaxID=981 RepID=A0AAN5APG2_9BACT|nr:exo-poly-alpha-D-galacturonosidase [Persicobacter diffluens]